MLGRLKFGIQPLVYEILDQLPQSVWESETTTFFDPAIGGGQFVAEVERRLTEYGHSKVNISERVFGAEQSKMRLNFAIQKRKLVGEYVVGDVDLDTEEAFGVKKFDVVVGNPPFAEGTNHNLYIKLVEKCLNLNPDFFALITPSSWIKSSNDLSYDIAQFPVKKIKFLTSKDWDTSYIPKIDTIYFICDKNFNGKLNLELKDRSYFEINYDGKTPLGDVKNAELTKHILNVQTNKKWIISGYKNYPKDHFPSFSVEDGDKKVMYKLSKKHGTMIGYVSKNEKLKDTNDDKWRLVFGFARTEVLAIVPPNVTILGNYVNIPFDTEHEARQAYNYFMTHFVRTILEYTRTSKGARTPQFSMVPYINFASLSEDINDEYLFKYFGTPQNVQPLIFEIENKNPY